ncbi:hypothetical protein G9A89_015716 [Geosiphon pyriformis]|nr:hypothetical protein G9A89_015716 [Geosiphon pyriformis]
MESIKNQGETQELLEEDLLFISKLIKEYNEMTNIGWDNEVVDGLRIWITLEQNKSLEYAFNLLMHQKHSAQCNSLLGFFYNYSIGTPLNNEEAFKWYTIAGEKGDGFALTQIGMFYRIGATIEIDRKKMLEFYEKSAKRGHPQGAIQLATYTSDRLITNYWYAKAAEWGFPYALYRGEYRFNCDGDRVLKDFHFEIRSSLKGFRKFGEIPRPLIREFRRQKVNRIQRHSRSK